MKVKNILFKSVVWQLRWKVTSELRSPLEFTYPVVILAIGASSSVPAAMLEDKLYAVHVGEGGDILLPLPPWPLIRPHY